MITGITGQDGAYLSKLLLSKGYKVFGTFRRLSSPNFWRLSSLGVLNDIVLVPVDLSDLSSLIEALNISQPDEIYNLAAQSFVGRSFEEPISTGEITGLSVTRILEASRIVKMDAKIYQASTSEIYGNNSSKVKTEESVFAPASPYAAAKLYGYWMSNLYKKAYGMYVSNGILFNHESPLRGLEFVTRKVTNAVARIKLGLQDRLELGNLNSIRDWGFAVDYTDAMWKILQQDLPEDFVIATGVGHSVKELVDLAFDLANLNSDDYVQSVESFKRLVDVDSLIGDSSKAHELLNWTPKTSFKELIKLMYEEDIRRWNDFLNGKGVVWDAPSYIDKTKIANVRYSIKV